MGYKLLGFAVWRAATWYVKKRVSAAQRKLAIAGVSGVVLAGVVLAAKSRAGQ